MLLLMVDGGKYEPLQKCRTGRSNLESSSIEFSFSLFA
jgi:hypothetical protein